MSNRIVMVAAFVTVVWGAALLQAEPEATEPARARIVAALQRDNTIEVEAWLSLPRTKRALFVVDLGGIESLEGVAVETESAGLSMRLPFSVQRRSKARAICWDFPPGSGPCSFRLRYRLTGIVHYGEDRDEASWTIISKQNELAFESVTLTVAFRRSIPRERVLPSLYTAAATTACVVEKDGVKVTARNLPARSALRLHLALPSGSVERRFFLNRFMKTTGGTILMFLLPVLSFAGLFTAFWLRGRDPSAAIALDEPARPSAGVTAEIAGAVIDEFAEPRDLVAGAVELARTGYLKFVFRKGEGDQLAELTALAAKPADGLRPHELRILNLFAGKGEGSAPAALAADTCLPREDIQAACDGVYSQATRDGYFRKNPAAERRAYVLAGILVLIAGIAFIGLSASIFGDLEWAGTFLVLLVLIAATCLKIGNAALKFVLGCAAAVLLFASLVLVMPLLGNGGMTWFAKVGWGLVISSLFVLAFAPMMPQRTQAGASEKARLVAFRARALSAMPDAADLATTQAEFERMLPFAVALRFKKEWVNKSAAAGVRVPAWCTIVSPDAAAETAGERPLAQLKQEFLETLSILATAVGESPLAGSGG